LKILGNVGVQSENIVKGVGEKNEEYWLTVKEQRWNRQRK
jgi:hypothetical protein